MAGGRELRDGGTRGRLHALQLLVAEDAALHALALYVLERLRARFAAVLAFEVARCDGGVVDRPLLVRRQRVPPLLARQDDPRAVDVPADGQILLHLVELAR